ncbi:ankyrin-2 isoform X3 [Agrilus planipennis]|uniref:Ankyrin-2 isoform X3 n=1 Tax=Agrilus planipennis TaxID=224129 RepID=A0A7F5RG76_AGRPL|nr:ankyrin-2 isoform X3 [Agrilus planipennis]
MAQFVTHIQPTLVEASHHHPPEHYHHHHHHHHYQNKKGSHKEGQKSHQEHAAVYHAKEEQYHQGHGRDFPVLPHEPHHAHEHHHKSKKSYEGSDHQDQHNKYGGFAGQSSFEHPKRRDSNYYQEMQLPLIDAKEFDVYDKESQFVSNNEFGGRLNTRPIPPQHIDLRPAYPDYRQSDGNTSFLRAARAGHLDKVLEHLKQNIDINTSNSNGLNALHLASKDGHVEVVKELLSRGAAVDAATKKGNTALHIASLAGQEEVVKLLIQSRASVNVQSQNGFTPLYMAAQENHDNVVKYLLANGANQSLATEDGFTPLAVAMQQGHEKVVTVLLENDTRGKVRLPALHIAAKKDDVKAAKLLLENDHNPDVTSKSGFTPLHIASHYGNEAIANLLIQKGADVNYAAKHNISPLHVAAKWGKTNMVALLIEKGANIEAKTRDGLTPLHCAARSGHEQVVDMLLEKSAPISSKTKNGLAPLHMAAQGDHVDAARILLYHRAPVDEVTVDYLTALHVAAHCGHVRVAKLLLDRGADANARALNGFTPLHIACKKNRIKVVELLLKHGASIEATTESGLTPLHVASFMGCMNIVIYLLQHNANPDVPTVRGETPLHLAARANQTDIIRILLRNGANVDARAREQQTPLHIASRLGNVDIVMLLLQHGAKVDTTTKDMYTALHIASKEGQDEVAAILIDNGASVNAVTKKGFTSLHLAAKYGHIKVAKLLLQKEAAVDAQGKNGVTPLHVASHYDHQNVALLLLDKGASPHAAAKNGHTPLHIAAKKNQMDIANTLLEYGADPNTESKAGFTPLHLSAQEGHDDMSSLLLEHKANPDAQAKNGLTPMHLCAQEDRVPVAEVLAKAGADVDCQTKSGYTPLHIACHYGQINMVRFLISKGASVKSATNLGYTPLHQAAQQGHTLIVNILLKNKAPPNAVTVNGQTPLSIAQKLGYISVIETLKVVTETTVTTTTVTTIEEKYRVVAPEAMQETFMSDSEEEGGEDTVLADHAYRYLTADEMKSLGDDSLPIDVTRDEKIDSNKMATSADSNTLPPQAIDESISPQHINQDFIDYARKYTADNMDILKQPINIGFLVSFLVDARGGAMRGCRHSGVRIIVPPQCAASPTRITCRYVRPQRTPHPPPLMEGEALASRVLELGPVGAKFLGPVIIEVPHFAALRGKEREIVILRSDNGETWREHTIEAADEIMNDVLNKSFEEDDLNQLEDPSSGRITRIVTNDFPQYFAVVTRIHQEVHAIGPEGGMVSSTVVPQVQAVFPQGALTKKIKVGLQAQPIDPELTAKLLGHGVAVSPVVTVEPRRRKFHKAITLSMPAPRAHSQGMINQYSGSAPTLRLLCSITGGTTRAQWEDVTGSTPLTFVNDCVSFTTTVSARFWLMDCRNIGDATKMATELYREAIHVPFMAKFVVFAKRVDPLEARLRVFCMTDDKEDKTLEQQEHFTEVAKSRDVEVLEGKPQFVEFSGNLVPITKSGEQLQFSFRAFRENRLPFSVRVKDQHAEAIGRCLFMREPKVAKGDPPQQPICILNIVLPDDIVADTISLTDTESYKKSGFLQDEFEYYMPDPRISDMSNLLGEDWVPLAAKLGLTTSEINVIKSEYPDSVAKQAQSMLRMWRAQTGHRGHSNILESALKAIGREDIIQHCLRLQQSNIPRKEDQITDNIYYEKENIMKGIENEIIRTKVVKEEDYKKDENYETKYSAEEKVIEESDDEETFKKSVIERRHVIERKMSSDRTVPSSQRIEIVQEISSIKSLVEDKVAEAEEKQKTIIIKPYTAKSKFDDLETKKIHDDMTNKQIDLKNQRDEKLLEGVSQRLEEEEKLSSICTNDDPYSPKSSKTPPPSPADFVLKERASAIQEKDKADVPQQQQEIVQIKDEKADAVLGQLTRNETTDLTASRTEPTPSVLLLTKTNETQITTEKPTPQEEDSRVDSITYSEKKKFWESISSQESEADTSKSSKKQEVTFSEIVPPPVPKPRQSKQQRTDVESTTIKRTDSFDSQSEAAPNQGGYDNTGYISDSEDVEHYISDSEIEDRVPQIRERQMSVFYPTTGLGRKSIYERSLSLPTQDLYDIKNQLKLKKEHIEEQIKKGMVVEQLSTEFEEELPPEYKSFEMDNSKEEQKLSETRSAPEATTDDEIEQISEEVSKMATSKDVQKQSETEKLKDDTLYEQQEILYSKNVVMTTDEFLKSEKSLYDYSLTTTQIKDSKQMDSLFHKVEAFTEKSESSLIKETDLSAETHKSHQITSQQTHKIKDETIKFDTHKDRDIDLHVDKSEIEELEKESDNKRAEKPKAKERVAILKSPINLPEEKMESTIWETPVQVSKTIDEQAPEFSVENNKLSSLAQSSLDQEAFEELGPTRKLQVENILIQSLSDDSITLDEAKKMAASLMDDIEKEIQKCKPLTPSATESIPGGIFTCDKELKTSLLKLAEEKGLDKREMQLVESVLARKQRGLKSKDDATHASSVEITDEDLKYSGVEIDFSPSSSRSYILEQLEAEKQQKVFTETMPALDTLETKQQHLDHDLITEEKETKYVDEKEEKIVQDESTEVAKETEKKATSVEQIEDETIHKTITHKTSEDDKDQTVQTHSSGSKSSKEDSFQSPEGSRTDTEQGGKSGSFKKDQTSSSTSNLKSAGDRRSGTDFEGYSSSGESHYQSFEIDSSKSRPCSSDFEGLNVVASSEYESALTSQQTSGLSHGMSDYHTAISSLTSKESMKSLDSESSGNLASFEASEASETLVPSALENENDILEPVEVIDDFHEKIGEEIKAQHFDTPSKMKRSHEMTFQQEPVDDELIRRTSTDDLSTLRKFSGEESPSYLEKEMQSEMKSTTESYTSTASTVIEVPMDSVTLTSSTFTEGNTSYASTQIVSKAVDEDKAQQQQIETIEPKKRGHRRSESSLLGQTGQIPYMTNIEMKQKCDDFISGELLEYETDEKEYDKKYTQREEIINQQTKVAAPILEDEAEHPKEVEERSQKRRDSQDEQPLPGITVTQHMAPLKDKGFHYPDLELEEQQAAPDNSTPETPASASSKTSEESDQGKVYVLQQDSTKSTTVPPAAAQITKTEKPLIESRQETPITAHKVAKSGKDKEAEPTSESPDSDSFEMLEKPDLIDDFVVIEEVAKEASEQDQEGKSVRIEYSKKPTKKHDEEVENYLIQSSSKQAQFSTGKTQETKDDLAFDFESSPPMPELKSASEPDSKTKEYFHSYEQELEGNRKWIEQQFQGDQATMAAGYGYEMEFERAPLEDIKEEEVADFDSSRIGSLSSHKDGSAGSIKDSYSSTPEYDVLAGRKYFTRSGEHDDVSMSSLQEFENLERAMSLENKKPHQGSQDSSSTSGSSYGKRYSVGKNGQVDDISTNSLKEFEGLEKACIAVHKIEEKVKQEEALLTQIEEGHESVASESESCETLSGTGKKAHSSDSDNKMLEIDAIIKQAQCSMDKFIDFKDDEKPESIGRGDSLEEVSKIPDLDLDTPMQKATKVQWVETNDDPMVNSTDSLDLNLDKSPHHDSTDSLDQKTTARDPMTASTDSIEYQSKQKTDKDVMRSDSFDNKDERDGSYVMTLSDSLELGTTDVNQGVLSDSIDEEGSRIGIPEHSTSSSGKDFSSSVREEIVDKTKQQILEFLPEDTENLLEISTSTATHATYHNETDSIFSGSFTSGSNTMVSSTEAIDPNTETINLSAAIDKLWYDDPSNIEPYVSEKYQVLPEDDQYSHIIHKKIEMPTTVQKVTFTGPNAEEELRKYLETVGPSQEQVQETTEIDEFGNVHRKRIVTKQVVVGAETKIAEPLKSDEQYGQVIRRKIELPPTITKVSFTGEDADEQLRKYLETVEPKEETEETEVDEFGNIHTKKTIRKRIVLQQQDPQGDDSLQYNILKSGQRQTDIYSVDISNLAKGQELTSDVQKLLTSIAESSAGESSDHPQSAATVKESDTAVKGEESKQTKEGKKDKQVKDQHKLSEEMEELLEAMKEVGKK